MKNLLIFTALGLFTVNASGQKTSANESARKTTFVLPDGKVLKDGKLDSLTTAWGGQERMIFQHGEEDDKKGIYHVSRKTDEMVKKSQEEVAARENAFSSMINKPAPLFEAKDITGKTWSLNALKGKTVVLNFWFTRCAPCVKEIPELNKLVEEYKGKDVVFLAFTYNSSDVVEEFLKKRKFDYAIITDSKEIDTKYNVSNWPTSMVIDKNGFVRKITNYSATIGEDLKTIIDNLQ